MTRRVAIDPADPTIRQTVAMALTSEEARVLACLVEKETMVPDSYPLTLNALRLACNQTSNRSPVVAYDDRTVDAALLSLKSMGLVRFVHPAHGGRTTRYRHTADERWRLEPAELGVLATLVLRGPQTAAEVRQRAARHLGSGASVDEALDALASRRPEPLAERLGTRHAERGVRFAHLLTGSVELPDEPSDHRSEIDDPTSRAEAAAPSPDVVALAAEVAELRARLGRLEAELGLDDRHTDAGR